MYVCIDYRPEALKCRCLGDSSWLAQMQLIGDEQSLNCASAVLADIAKGTKGKEHKKLTSHSDQKGGGLAKAWNCLGLGPDVPPPRLAVGAYGFYILWGREYCRVEA